MGIHKLKTYLSAFVLLVAGQNAFAGLTIEITQGVDSALPIAVVPFDTSSLTTKMPEDIAGIVANDLNRSGVLRVMDRSALPEKPYQSNQVNYGHWRNAGQDYLLVGRVLEESAGFYRIEFQLLDVLKRQYMFGQVVKGKQRVLRKLAHRISDLVYEKITGTRGAFDTRIAYVRKQENADYKYVLEIADSDGVNPQTMLSSNEPIMSPSWSPDGNYLAYVSFESRFPEVYVQHVQTARRSKIAAFAGVNSAPSWSPDGKHLALVLSKDGSPDIYIMDTSTRRLQQLTTHRSIDTEPVWTPDGRSIIFTSDRSGTPQIYQLGIDGGRPRRLTFEGKYNSAPSLSPDGRYLTMVHQSRGQYNIAQLELETGNLSLLTDGSLDESPSFSPNGKMVLYASTLGNSGVLYVVTIDGRSKHKLSDQAGDIREPAWGPFESN